MFTTITTLNKALKSLNNTSVYAQYWLILPLLYMLVPGYRLKYVFRREIYRIYIVYYSTKYSITAPSLKVLSKGILKPPGPIIVKRMGVVGGKGSYL